MKHINTLIQDVYHVAEKESWFTPEDSARYSAELGNRVMERLAASGERSSLRLSAMGEQCPRSLWASVHASSIREKFPAPTRIKFHYGDVIEAMAVALAKAAGHEVTGEQDELELLGIKGHRDCVIDGCIVDVKSVNSLGFQRIKSRQVESDVFLRSYLDQLDGYAVASIGDPLVRRTDVAYIWAVDKQLGHMTLYEHTVRKDHITARVASYKEIVARDTPPACTCGTKSEGASGNIKLDLKASYNPYKYFCFPHLRKFYYADGKDGKIIHLVKVVKEPRVPEIDRDGNFR
jgi:hypothetical protein